jgi:hypothetical protein
LNDRERLDRLRLAVLLQLELILLEVEQRLSIFVADDDVDANVVDAGLDSRRLLLVGRRLSRRSSLRARGRRLRRRRRLTSRRMGASEKCSSNRGAEESGDSHDALRILVGRPSSDQTTDRAS